MTRHTTRRHPPDALQNAVRGSALKGDVAPVPLAALTLMFRMVHGNVPENPA